VSSFGKIIARIVVLTVAVVVLATITWFAVGFIEDGIDARMMAFQSEPLEGRDYWRWHYFKESMPGNLTLFAALAALWGGLIWAWVSAVKTAIHKSP